MSTLKVIQIQHPSAASAALTLDSSGNLTTSGTLTFPAGSASAPAIQATGDSNTGLFFPAADTIAFAEGGTEVLRIDSSGRVGIGTSSASGMLHVKGTNPQLIVDTLDASTEPRIRLYKNGSPVGQLGGESGTTRLLAEGAFQIMTNGGTNAVYVDSSQRVGIGTTSPQNKFVVSNGGAEGYEISPGFASNDNLLLSINRSGSVYCGNTQNASFHRWLIQDSEKARLDTSGRLLVGTSTTVGANRTLQVAGTGAEFFYNAADNDAPPIILSKSRGSLSSPTIVSSGDNTGFIRFRGYDGSGYVDTARIESVVDGTPGTNDMPGRLVFSTTADGASSPTERVRITNTGETRITGGGTGTNQALFVQNSTPSRLLGVREDGYTQWGVATNSPYNFGVSSSTKAMFMDSSGGFGFNSSIRAAKTNIELAPSAGWIGNLNVVTFNYRLKNQAGDYSDDYSDEMRWGVIADDAEAVCPDFCSYDSEGKLDGFHYDRLVPVLLKALQESNKRIETLEAEVAALKGA